MNCYDARAGLLTGETSEPLQQHLDGCGECRAFEREVAGIRTGLSSESVWAEPPTGMEDDVVAAILGSSGSDASRESRQTSRTVAFLGTAAAVVVLLVGSLAYLRSPPPDWEAVMVAADAGSVVTGVVAGWSTEAGTRILLEAEDLAVAPEGFVYQLWFSRDSTDVSAGTFSDPSRVELTVGIARVDYPDVWISLDPIESDEDTGPALLHTVGS